jgi:LemA protein
MSVLTLIISILAIIAIYILITYNSIVKQKNKVLQAASAIDIYLTQRFDLIPNLVECVKGYMEFEQETFIAIVKKRNIYLQNKSLKDGEELNNECNRIILLAENYSELKANEQFINLQKKLSKIESQLQAARRIYNTEVNKYNNNIEIFPSNIIADAFNFKQEEFFQPELNVKDSIKVEKIQ